MKKPSNDPRPTNLAARALAASGFTMIEMLVALFVLAISATALFSLGSTTIKGNTKNEDQSVAMSLAVSKMEELRNMGFTSSSLVSGSDGPMGPSGTGSGIYSRTWSVASTTLSGVSTSAKTLSVTVSWTGGGALTINSLVVNPAEVTSGFTTGFPTASIKSWEQNK